MCGRARCALGRETVRQVAAAAAPGAPDRAADVPWRGEAAYAPVHNAAPGFTLPVVVCDKGRPEIRAMTWGLVPSFTKPDAKPDHWRMFNARSESAAELPSFRRLLQSRRCLVPLSGFFEWRKEAGKKAKQPFYIFLVGRGSGGVAVKAEEEVKAEEGAPAAGPDEKEEEHEDVMVLAGLWDSWRRGGGGGEAADGGALETFTILTCDASGRLSWLHDRMPVVLRTAAEQRAWLAAGRVAAAGPYGGADLRWRPVAPRMSSVAYQGADAAAALPPPPPAAAFFRPRAAGAQGAGSAAAAAAGPSPGAKPEAPPPSPRPAPTPAKRKAAAAGPAGGKRPKGTQDLRAFFAASPPRRRATPAAPRSTPRKSLQVVCTRLYRIQMGGGKQGIKQQHRH